MEAFDWSLAADGTLLPFYIGLDCGRVMRYLSDKEDQRTLAESRIDDNSRLIINWSEKILGTWSKRTITNFYVPL